MVWNTYCLKAVCAMGDAAQRLVQDGIYVPVWFLDLLQAIWVKRSVGRQHVKFRHPCVSGERGFRNPGWRTRLVRALGTNRDIRSLVKIILLFLHVICIQ